MSRYATTLFCDDIRHEIGGKTSLIGVYDGKLLVNEFPATLNKLCLIVHLYTSEDKKFESLDFKVFLEETVIAEIKVSPEQLAQATPPKPEPENGKKKKAMRQKVAFTFIFSPLLVEKPGHIKILAKTESTDLRAPGLKIDLAPEGTAFGPN